MENEAELTPQTLQRNLEADKSSLLSCRGDGVQRLSLTGQSQGVVLSGSCSSTKDKLFLCILLCFILMILSFLMFIQLFSSFIELLKFVLILICLL